MLPQFYIYIQSLIKKSGGFISFAQFMELALYHPQWGYYCTRHFLQDFTTAPAISPLFAQCFAKQVAPILQEIHHGSILELGAGSGQFAKTLLLTLEQQHCLPQYYFIKEISPLLRQTQQQCLQTHCAHLMKHVVWIENWLVDFHGVIIANEVLDALPVHAFEVLLSPSTLCVGGESEGVKIQERCVTWKDNQFAWCTTPFTDPQLAEKAIALQQQYNLAPGYRSEINLAMLTLTKQLAHCLTKGALFFADYGYGQREYYHPERRQGTLTCFHQHQYHDNPLILVGEQDMTAHVDFTSLTDMAIDASLTLAGYTTQSAFLISCGLLALAEEQTKHMNISEQYQQSQAIKQLLWPSAMGETVKVIAFTKGLEDIPLLGFTVQDRKRDL
ncbi:MAG: hypothetical protein A3E83_02740 [Gammaproteobacteria bacterium RIFCSPHIGHO2_12_FULL_41_20]|nr:MAG: hypothetical protein A3E83_02740 [Gammaproteobacteria bacterium RIFCSPHIGHO2_12_FULL_41_20]